MRILVTDGDERAALAATRSLTAAGHDVHVASARRWSLAGVSRGVHAHALRASPLDDPAGYAAAVGKLAAALELDVLLPVTDASVEALLEHRLDMPQDVVLPFPSYAIYRRASDKVDMLALARASGIAIPETIVLASPQDVERVPDSRFFPAVVKPHRSIVEAAAGSRRLKVGVSFVPSPQACRRVISALPPAAFPILLQRHVHGAGEGLFVLRYGNAVLALFAHRRIREKPPAGGVSVFRESITLDAELAAAGCRLLEALDWQGVAMVECKRDRLTGRPVFMEINGRLWGSLQLAIDAGVDFVALLVAAATGGEVTPVSSYRAGVRSRWFWGDVDHLYLRLTRSPRKLHLSNGNGSRLHAIRDFLTIRPGRDREEIFRWRDPGPFIVETLRRLPMVH